MGCCGRTRLCYAILFFFSPLLVPLACATWPLLLVVGICRRLRCGRNKEGIGLEREGRRVARCEKVHHGEEEGRVEVGLMQRYLEDQLRLVRSVLDNNCHCYHDPVLGLD
ncbi:hypothetical protein MLD38_001119 [Melastoma candidum]|uniref:Uncharacterized protein n=1 Tax=Melastoma candidum TaxID=119954 RepID=A0ACB9SCN5_9MYRT|nr:hypothetical protein MLD38_001119 [Melastoma candidum]